MTHKSPQDIKDVSDDLLDQIEHFFVSYNEAKGKKFKILARRGPSRAEEVVRKGLVED